MDAKRKDISFVEKLINIGTNPIASLLDLLLKDKSTKKNIIWATDTYQELGEGFSDKEQISSSFLLRHTDIIKPRIQKTQETQQERTRKKAEVFTPAWLCNQMNNYCDEEWFGRKYVFNVENDDHTWTVREELIQFPEGRTWREYVDSRRLEITCGEAPYLMSRYDVSTGELIVPTKRRIGQLDRKLRIVNENTENYDEWVKWAVRAFEASYGYEYQGDNLLIARINSLMTFLDYYEERWDKEPDEKLLKTVTNKIVWNLWQMDGLQDTVPLGKPYEKYYPVSLFDEAYEKPDEELEAVPSKIYDWRRDNSIFFNRMKARKAMGNKLFNFIIGNPPYQEDTTESTRKRPVYNTFMDGAYSVADKVELITPARFLFDAGQTPKVWNRQMLEDKHLKVLYYEGDATKIFSNTDIKGGIAITYHDCCSEYKPIGVFTKYNDLNLALSKVRKSGDKSIESIVSARGCYRLSEKFFKDLPNASSQVGKGTGNMIVSNIFEKIPEAFFADKPDDMAYVKIIGRERSKRTAKFLRRDYIIDNGYIDTYNVLISEANNTGEFGETLVEPHILMPGEGATDTFISIGFFLSKTEAENVIKYIKTKFCRAMLGVKKATQHTAKSVWEFVPIQDFTSKSDIDWSKSVHEIDLQLYKKYGLDEKEINFIETHVKEMA